MGGGGQLDRINATQAKVKELQRLGSKGNVVDGGLESPTVGADGAVRFGIGMLDLDGAGSGFAFDGGMKKANLSRQNSRKSAPAFGQKSGGLLSGVSKYDQKNKEQSKYAVFDSDGEDEPRMFGGEGGRDDDTESDPDYVVPQRRHRLSASHVNPVLNFTS